MKITQKFPTGYLKAEKEFCRAEEKILFSCTEMAFHPDRIKARNRLLSKRTEFKKKWNKGK